MKGKKIMFKILGYEIKEGTFNNKPYSNIVLYCEDLENYNENVKGHKVEIIKIKSSLFEEICNVDLVDCLSALIDDVSYDKYGNIRKLVINNL